MRLVRVLGFALLGLPAALVWVWWAEPATWLVTADRGLVMGETQAANQIDSVATFVIIGAVVGIAVGLGVGYLERPFSWHSVAVAVLGSLAAAVVCWAGGRTWGPGPSDSTASQVGATVPAELVVDTPVAFLVWPLFALLVTTVVAQLSYDDPSASHPVGGQRAL